MILTWGTKAALDLYNYTACVVSIVPPVIPQTGESTSLGILPVKDTHIASLHIQLRGKERMVELHKAEQRWTPFKDRMRDATVDIYGKFQGFLNKLTPQKFQVLAEQALQLEINTEERLKGIVDKIFTKVHGPPTVGTVFN